MQYIYVLEGRLKYETITFDRRLTFVLYNGNANKRNENLSQNSDEIIYFLKNDKFDLELSVDLVEKKITFSKSIDNFTAALCKSNGERTEVKISNVIDIEEDTVKFSLPDADFSFLINTDVDPEKGKAPLAVKPVSKFHSFFENKMNVAKAGLALLFVIVIIGYLISDESVITGKPSYVIFNTEVDLMRANVSGLDSREIVVKSDLINKVRKELESMGIQFIRFDLQAVDGQINMILWVFDDFSQSVNEQIAFNKFQMIESINVVSLDPQDMYQSFNLLAEKYGLPRKNIFNQELIHELVDMYVTNNNILFNSVQRDIHDFYARWGQNFIEFNVVLREPRQLSADFMLVNDSNDQTIMRSGRTYYFN